MNQGPNTCTVCKRLITDADSAELYGGGECFCNDCFSVEHILRDFNADRNGTAARLRAYLGANPLYAAAAPSDVHALAEYVRHDR